MLESTLPSGPDGSVARSNGASDEASEVECPKCGCACGRGQRGCPRCGLLVARFPAFRAARRAEARDDSVLDGAWEAARAAWSDGAAHDRLVDLATDHDLLPSLARRYSEALRDGADPVAERNIRRIYTLLEHRVRAQARESSSGGARALWALGYSMAAFVLVAAAWFFFVVVQRRG